MNGPMFTGMMMGALILIFGALMCLSWVKNERARLREVHPREPRPVKIVTRQRFYDGERDGWV